MAAGSQSASGDPPTEFEVEERAFVNPDDINKIGDPKGTLGKVQMLVERIKAEQNTPDGLWSQVARWGGFLVAVFVGYWFGSRSGGGGGGSDGSSSASPLVADIGTGVLDTASQFQTLALEVGVGVV